MCGQTACTDRKGAAGEASLNGETGDTPTKETCGTESVRPAEDAKPVAYLTDEYKRALAVLQLDDRIPLDMTGLSVKYVQRMRRKFRSISILAFKDKRHNNAPVLLTKPLRDEVLVMLGTTQEWLTLLINPA